MQRRTLFLGGSAIIAAMVASPVMAQTNPSPVDPNEAVAVEDIIVTARRPGTQSYRAESAVVGTKMDARLADTPISASVVTRQFLDDTQATTITESLRFVPGVYSGDNGRAAVDENLSVRGFSYLRSTFIDGTRQQAYNIDINPEPYGLERIEVLRGAGAVLYGSTQPGGLVNSVTRRPGWSPSAETLVSGGSLDLLRLGFDATGPLPRDDRFAARITGFLREQDDVADTAFNNRRYLAPAIAFAPSDTTQITLLTSWQSDRFRLVPYLPAEGTLRPNVNGSIPRERFLGEPGLPDDKAETLGARLIVSHDIGEDLRLRHVTGYRDYDRTTNYIYVDLADEARLAERSLYPISTQATVWSTDTSLEATRSFAGADHRVLIGVDYYRIRDRSQTEGASLAPIDAFSPVYGAQPVLSGSLTNDSLTKLDQYGLYVQDQITIGDRWILLAGGRLDRFELSYDDPVSGYAERIDEDLNFVGRYGLVYKLTDEWSPYASYTEGFYPQGGVDAQGRPFEPDESDQVEAGVKFESRDGRSSASLAAFSITRRNLLSTDPDNPNFSIQTGEQRHRGVELEFNVAVTPNLGVLGSYAYLDAEITRNNQLIDGQSIVGKRPANVPEHAGALWAVYSFTPGSTLAGLSLTLGARMQSSREGDTLNTFRTPSFTLWDASVAYSFDRWRLSLNAVNLTDETYVAATTGYSDYIRYGDPRLILFSVTRAW